MRNERADHTLQATALVHEAYLRLVDDAGLGAEGRSCFFAQAALAMRRILVDFARRKRSDKRGGSRRRVPLDAGNEPQQPSLDLDVLALDESLVRLAQSDPEKVQVVEMRFFAGMTHEEIAAALGQSTRTIERHWRYARAWLYRDLNDGAAPPGPESTAARIPPPPEIFSVGFSGPIAPLPGTSPSGREPARRSGPSGDAPCPVEPEGVRTHVQEMLPPANHRLPTGG